MSTVAMRSKAVGMNSISACASSPCLGPTGAAWTEGTGGQHVRASEVKRNACTAWANSSRRGSHVLFQQHAPAG